MILAILACVWKNSKGFPAPFISYGKIHGRGGIGRDGIFHDLRNGSGRYEMKV